MAKKPYRPLRTLLFYFTGLGLIYVLVAISGAAWSPTLGLDLQGGTRIQLSAEGNPTGESMSEARRITDQRVNGSGVAEAEVSVQGSTELVVEIPGEQAGELEEVVKQQAELRFRLVACSPGDVCGGGLGGAEGFDPSQLDPSLLEELEGGGDGVTAPEAPVEPEDPAGSNNRPAFTASANEQETERERKKRLKQLKQQKQEQAEGTASDDATNAPAGDASEKPAPTDAPTDEEGTENDRVAEELAWARNPSPGAVEQYNSLFCDAEGNLVDENDQVVDVEDNPDEPLVACSLEDTFEGEIVPPQKYLLSRAVIEGTELDDASAGIPQGQIQWAVNLELGGEGRSDFAEISRSLFGTEEQFAIVLDGDVLSAPTMDGVITNGQAQITGGFNEVTATALANQLKFGALPVSFDDSATTVQTIGPTLAGNQLTAGLTAGAIGLALVMLYALLYYRGLGMVIISSLFVAAAMVYGLVLLLAEAANFTLTLPGIAGLIIAVGITADSFIVFFERIRDEMRDGKSMRVAVESGWIRARATAVYADAVSLLAAVVLYIFAAGVVKGFAFALGLTTLIDLVVFFFFTKPLVSWLATREFFNKGHRLSGLDRNALGFTDDGPAPEQQLAGAGASR